MTPGRSSCRSAQCRRPGVPRHPALRPAAGRCAGVLGAGGGPAIRALFATASPACAPATAKARDITARDFVPYRATLRAIGRQHALRPMSAPPSRNLRARLLRRGRRSFRLVQRRSSRLAMLRGGERAISPDPWPRTSVPTPSPMQSTTRDPRLVAARPAPETQLINQPPGLPAITTRPPNLA